MQNHSKTELYLHLNPQMRSREQLFWSIVTIKAFSSIIFVRSIRNFFSHPNAIDAMIEFSVGLLTRGMLLMKEKREIWIIGRGRVGPAFCNRPKPKLLLLKDKFIIKCIQWKTGIVLVGKYIFPKYIVFKCASTLKIEEPLEIQSKRRIWSVLENSFISINRKASGECGKKVRLFSRLNFCFAKSDLRVWEDIFEKSGRKMNHIVGKTWNLFVFKSLEKKKPLCSKVCLCIQTFPTWYCRKTLQSVDL